MKMTASSNEIIGEKRTLSLSALLSVFAFFIVGVIVFGPFLGTSKDQAHQKALGKAQSLAYQIASLDEKRDVEAFKDAQSNAQSTARRNASIAAQESGNAAESGTIGLDPWGQVYHYKIRHEGRNKIVDVWSLGENAIQTQVLIPSESPKN